MAVNAYGGSPKHGELSGLGNDDHPQYSKTEHGHADYLPLTGKAADSELLDGIDSTGFLRTTGKAADSDKLDGLDSLDYLRMGHVAATVSDGARNTLHVINLNAPLASGWYDTQGGTGAPSSAWWLIQVVSHVGGSHWQRQIAHSMTSEQGTQFTLSRRCNGGDPTLAASWSAWHPFGGGDNAWTAASMLNGWVRYDATYTPPQFRKINGRVEIQGMIRSGTMPSVAFNLPVGYRPVWRLLFDAISNTAQGRIDVTPNGDVHIMNGSNAWVSLDGIYFLAEA